MTVVEWLTCTDPRPMLEHLQEKASDRKLRLFACYCCRTIWHLLRDQQARDAVELAELHADGLVNTALLIQALKLLPMPVWPGGGPEIFNWRLVTPNTAADMTDARTYVWLTAALNRPDLTRWLVAKKWAEREARAERAVNRAVASPFRRK